jgi:hypothetical protein
VAALLDAGRSSLNDDGRTAPAADSEASKKIPDRASSKNRAVAVAARNQIGVTIRYDASYQVIKYPDGDVTADRGACTDVVIRALRARGIDLQERVHQDMTRDFSAYPRRWRLDHPDSNIDHRRVPNLQVYFRRADKDLPITKKPLDYQPGDIVAWRIDKGTHVGVVSAQRSVDGQRFCVIHNIGRGVEVNDRLFAWKIIGHYRWF